MHEPLVSIIVPVYGVEAYLPECVDSLLGQSHQNLEIILADDASPDRCGKICDEYAAREERVKVIHKENGGAASARNAALDIATGEYICFVDSDDLVDRDYVRLLLNNLQDQNADVAVCAFTVLTRQNEQTQEIEDAGCFSAEGYLTQFLRYWTCALIWNKMFRRDVVGDIRFAEGHRIDDEFFTYRLILHSHRVAVFHKPLYRYRQRCSSVMKDVTEYQERMLLDRVEYLTKRLEDVRADMPKLKTAFLEDLLDSFVRFRRQCAGMPKVLREMERWMRKNLIGILASDIPAKRKSVLLWQLAQKPGNRTENASIGDPEDYFP